MNINYNKDKTDEIREIIKSRINETGISIKKLSKKSKVGYLYKDFVAGINTS